MKVNHTFHGLERVICSREAQQRHLNVIKFIMEAGSPIIFLNITETKLNSRESRIKLPDGLALKIDKFLSHVVSIRIEIKLKVEMYKTKLTILL